MDNDALSTSLCRIGRTEMRQCINFGGVHSRADPVPDLPAVCCPIRHPEKKFNVERNELLERQLYMDGAIQTMVPDVLQVHLLYQAYYPLLSGYFGHVDRTTQ